MSSQTFNFAAMGIADPANPPAGLRNWSKTAGVGKIVEEGLQLSATGSGNPAWIVDGFIPTDNVIKLTFKPGLAPVGAIGSTGLGFIIAKNENAVSPADDDAYTFIAGASNVKRISVNGSPGANAIFTIKTNLVTDIFELYIDRTAGVALFFKNGRSVMKAVTGLADYTNYGVSLNASAIEYFSIEDAGATLPPYIGRDNVTIFYLHTSSVGYYSGFKPKFGRLAGFPLRLSDFNNGQMKIDPTPLNKIIGNVFTLPYGTNGLAAGYLSFSDFTDTVESEMAIRGAGNYNLFLSTDGSANLSNVNNINHYYTINGSTTGLPLGSYLFSDELNPVISTSASLIFSANGGVICADGGSGTVQRRIFIRDGSDGILRMFTGTFDLTTTLLTNMVYNPNYLICKFEQPLDTWVESNVFTIDGIVGTGAELFTVGGAQISYDTGSGWTEWALYTEADPLDPVSSLEPTPFKLRGKSSILPDTERQFLLKELTAVGVDLTWSVFTEIDTSVFLLDLLDDPEQTIIDLVNHENGTTFTSASVDVGDPSTYAGEIGGNSQVTVSAKPNKGFIGEIDFVYSRIDFSVFNNPSDKIAVTVPYEASWVDVIAAVNLACGVNLTTNDYEDEPTWVAPTTDLEWTLTIKSTSLVFFGSAVIDITVEEPSSVDIDTLVEDATLGGLQFPV